MKKRILSAILALLLALTLLPVSALAEEDLTEEIFQAEDEVLRVYELTPGSGSDRELRHTFTYGELCGLAEAGQLGYMFRENGWSICAVTEYAPLDRILAAAGLSLSAEDALRLRGADGGEATITGKEREKCTRFYPDGSSADVFSDVPAVVALAWSSGSAGDYGTLRDALANLAAAAARADLRFACGISAEEFAETSAPGARLTQSLREITIVHPCAEHAWTQTAGEAWRVSAAETCTEGADFYAHCSVCGQKGDAFSVPALGHDLSVYTMNDENTHTVKCSRCDVTETAAHVYENGVCVCGAKEPEKKSYTVAVSAAPAEIAAGEESTVSLKVGHTDAAVTAFNAYHLVLTYDTDKLTYESVSLADAQVTDNNGTLTILGYGDDKALQDITVTFTGKAAGTATVALTAANIDAQSNAHVQDPPRGAH